MNRFKSILLENESKLPYSRNMAVNCAFLKKKCSVLGFVLVVDTARRVCKTRCKSNSHVYRRYTWKT
ncbi:hypothetical protein SEA_MOLIVIA_17 [Arthrobacter phage Molivia]|uniref:Uncharacterized protein n=1 Tax=Arthrobacter phage Molivia TaxID=2015839 RepID=A0A286S1Y4_9CAUD|nr:hypothetical protein FDI28_gp17 [Arthrobacter phage Molivia]ASX99321.1 hypothetical protein SEA_MOLIVIA_17 [Arthrobacter phage Molivia]